MSVPDQSIDPRLLESARQEFLQHGFLKAELKTICENAGITTGAVYKRYKGKEDLFSAVVDDVVTGINEFVEGRSNIDFSLLSDEDVRSCWIMTYESMVPMFELLQKQHDNFVLLISKAAGTRYENFNHEFVTRMSYTYVRFYEEARKRGLAGAAVSREEFHVLISSFWTCVCEPFIHDMSWEEIEEHCRVICRFFNWKDVILLKEARTDNVS